MDEYLNESRWVSAVNGGQVGAIAPMALLRSRFEYAIRDTEFTERSRSELAFVHLCRSLAVDEVMRAKWQAAFAHHETTCEKLGAVHLLSHGIWAFKISGTGAATDLVFGEPLKDQLDGIHRTASTLVLTEWKRVQKSARLHDIAEQAREQTNRYQSGVLGALELKRTRYIVLVTDDDANAPEDVSESSVVFRHIVVSVKPRAASLLRPTPNV